MTDVLDGDLTPNQFDQVKNMLIDFNLLDLAMTTDSPAFVQMSNALPVSNQLADTLIIQAGVGSAPTSNEKFDSATIHSGFEELGEGTTGNLAKSACAFLARENVAGWNVNSKCHIVTFLNKPTHGTLIATENVDEYTYIPQRLGKDVIRFIVKNDDGRKAIVTWNIRITPYGEALNENNVIQTASL
jgi:hypothetical protein